MTRKNYVIIARILKETAQDLPAPEKGVVTNLLANRLANYMAWDNGRFDRDRFLDAVRG